MKRTIVISLGGSVIIPADKKDDFLLKFREVIQKNYSRFKFVLVCGGGSIARAYEEVLKKEHKSEKQQNTAGIRATRMNAEFVMQVFGKNEANDKLPKTIKEIKSNLAKNNVVVCGALRYAPKQTSDSTAARIASQLKADFLNITNVSGLYTSDPSKNPEAKLIKKISWAEFAEIAAKIKFSPGQHFVLDQTASKMIKKKRIKTYIIGKKIKEIEKFLAGKKFIGTAIGP